MSAQGPEQSSYDVDALIVGAGPTGLTLAAQLRLHGVRFRIVDRLVDRSRESRALAVQARTLEIFQTLGIAETLVSRGNTSARLVLHFSERGVVEVQLGDANAADTRFPFILFVSQAETEALLSEHLQSTGVTIERGIELATAQVEQQQVTCVLRHADGRDEHVRTRYLLGCDGAHSTVRQLAGLPFEGDTYPQDFVLGDVEVDGPLARDAINAFPRGPGIAMFFPLGHPRSWRVIAMAPDDGGTANDGQATGDATLAELQTIVDAPTGRSLRLRDPAWITHFRLHHRQTRHYRAGPIFLAGDAAHIHSPVGAQGMNTGIQDAWNLGWKIAHVVQGAASPELLDSYEAERWPVGRFLLRVTDRAFTLVARATSVGTFSAWVRRTIVPRVLPRVVASKRLRNVAFRFVSELDIRYRSSPVVREGEPRLSGGPRAGDRLPDAPITRDGMALSLHQVLTGGSMHLLLCGASHWDEETCAELVRRSAGLLKVHRLTHLTQQPTTGTLIDHTGIAYQRLAVRDTAQYLIRPDGHIAYRCAGHDLGGVSTHLARWYPHSDR